MPSHICNLVCFTASYSVNLLALNILSLTCASVKIFYLSGFLGQEKFLWSILQFIVNQLVFCSQSFLLLVNQLAFSCRRQSEICLCQLVGCLWTSEVFVMIDCSSVSAKPVCQLCTPEVFVMIGGTSVALSQWPICQLYRCLIFLSSVLIGVVLHLTAVRSLSATCLFSIDDCIDMYFFCLCSCLF